MNRTSRQPGEWLVSTVERFGSPEERRLVNRHREDLESFLDHPDTLVALRRGLFGIGFDNELRLRLSLMAPAGLAPRLLLSEWAERFVPLRDIAETVIRLRLRCHPTIRLSPRGIDHELIVYGFHDQLTEYKSHECRQRLEAGLDTPHCHGISTQGCIRAYIESRAVTAAARNALAPLGRNLDGLTVSMLYTACLEPGQERRVIEAEAEIMPFPSHVLNATINAGVLNFGYLVHRGGVRRYGLIDVDANRHSLFVPLLPTTTRNPLP